MQFLRHFYKPYISDKIGNLVVLGIRNSLLEIATSVNYKEYGLTKALSIDDIKLVTSNAIEYFKNIDINALSSQINLDDDYYYNIVKKYDIAYTALKELGRCSNDKLEIEFSKISTVPYVLEELLIIDNKKDNSQQITDIANGISNELAPGLAKLLKNIFDNKSSMLYVDSFKYLSRNFELNLKVLQFLLSHNAIFLTNNFLIKNGYVSKRKNLVQASHGNTFNIKTIQSIGDVSKKYKNDLEKKLEIKI